MVARVVYIRFGHNESTLRYPVCTKLVRNAVLWSAGKFEQAQSRKEHMSFRVLLAVAFGRLTLPLCAADPVVKINRFLCGASVYPELQTREEWNRMLELESGSRDRGRETEGGARLTRVN